jgi:hypothetical protein
MILAAGMISASMTGDFEWLYPLRFLAAAITLTLPWPLPWRRYADLDWLVGWLAPAVGAVVFLARLSHSAAIFRRWAGKFLLLSTLTGRKTVG